MARLKIKKHSQKIMTDFWTAFKNPMVIASGLFFAGVVIFATIFWPRMDKNERQEVKESLPKVGLSQTQKDVLLNQMIASTTSTSSQLAEKKSASKTVIQTINKVTSGTSGGTIINRPLSTDEKEKLLEAMLKNR